MGLNSVEPSTSQFPGSIDLQTLFQIQETTNARLNLLADEVEDIYRDALCAAPPSHFVYRGEKGPLASKQLEKIFNGGPVDIDVAPCCA